MCSFEPRGSSRDVPKPIVLLLVKNMRAIFPQFYFLRKETERRLLLTSNLAVLFKYDEIPEQIIEQIA
jgi:hypothetical protein